MKKIAILIGVAALLATVSAQADENSYGSIIKTTSVTYATGTTNLASPIVIDVRKQTDVSLSMTLRGATTATNICSFGWSVDGTTWSTNNLERVIWAPDSISAISSTRTTNIACGGYGYLVLYNVTATLINTNTLKVGTKIR